MIRVALVTANFPSIGQPYIFEWVAALKKAGIDITVLTENVFPQVFPLLGSSYIEWAQDIYLLNNISHPLHTIALDRCLRLSGFVHPVEMMRSLSVLKHSFGLKTVLRKSFEYFPIFDQAFDLVHFNAPQIAVRRFELGRILRAPTLISFRGQDFTFNPERYDLLLERADHLHFISNHLIEEAKKRGYTGGKHTLIPPMVDSNFYCPGDKKTPLADREFTLFTAARIEWSKGYEYSLQAVGLLLQRGWKIEYFIAGDGDFLEAVKFTIDQLGIQKHVHLLGWQSPQEVLYWMQRSDLYVLASVTEAFNNSVLQAQACGLPVVCSDEGGLPENIKNGETGLLARNRDAWDLADKMITLLADSDLRYKMGCAGRERVLQHYKIEEISRQFVELYAQITTAGGIVS